MAADVLHHSFENDPIIKGELKFKVDFLKQYLISECEIYSFKCFSTLSIIFFFA